MMCMGNNSPPMMSQGSHNQPKQQVHEIQMRGEGQHCSSGEFSDVATTGISTEEQVCRENRAGGVQLLPCLHNP